jgi:hypothetical protein
MTETTIAIMFLILGYIIGHHRGMKKGWKWCEAFMMVKIGEELEKLTK